MKTPNSDDMRAREPSQAVPFWRWTRRLVVTAALLGIGAARAHLVTDADNCQLTKHKVSDCIARLAAEPQLLQCCRERAEVRHRLLNLREANPACFRGRLR